MIAGIVWESFGYRLGVVLVSFHYRCGIVCNLGFGLVDFPEQSPHNRQGILCVLPPGTLNRSPSDVGFDTLQKRAGEESSSKTEMGVGSSPQNSKKDTESAYPLSLSPSVCLSASLSLCCQDPSSQGILSCAYDLEAVRQNIESQEPSKLRWGVVGLRRKSCRATCLPLRLVYLLHDLLVDLLGRPLSLRRKSCVQGNVVNPSGYAQGFSLLKTHIQKTTLKPFFTCKVMQTDRVLCVTPKIPFFWCLQAIDFPQRTLFLIFCQLVSAGKDNQYRLCQLPLSSETRGKVGSFSPATPKFAVQTPTPTLKTERKKEKVLSLEP